MKFILSFLLIVMLSIHAYSQDTITRMKPAVFAYVNIGDNLIGNCVCVAYFSNNTAINLAELLKLDGVEKSASYIHNRFRLLDYFYSRNYELIGTENDCSGGSCTHEFYFKLKDEK